MPRLAFFAASRAGRPPHEPPLPSSPSAKLLSAGLRWRFGYDAEHRLVEVRRRNADGSPGPVFGKFTYDALGRRASAVYDDSGDGELGDDTVEYFAYDPAWRLSCIYRQGPEDEFGIRPAPVAYERFLYADAGLAAADASFAPGFALDCPTHSQIDADADGTFERTRRYILNQFGDVAGVIEDHAPGAWSYELAEVVRYSTTGQPRVIGHFGADMNQSGGSPDDADVAAFFALYGEGDPRADFNGSGGTPDEADVALFFQVWDAGIGQGTPDDNRFGWRGYQWDARLGLYHVRHRVYDPRHAAWLTPDPAGYLDGLNLYAYCRGDLVNKFDPYGLWGWDGDWVETALKLTPPGVVANFILDYNNAVDFYAAAYSGLEDGLVMAADRYTFSQIDWLNEHSQQLMIEYGTPYEIAYGFSGVSRNAAMMAALAGAGQAAFGLQSVQSFIQAHPLLVTILDYLGVGLRVAGSAAGGYQAGTGIWQISQGDYANGVYNTGSGLLLSTASIYPNSTTETSIERARRLGEAGERASGIGKSRTGVRVPGSNRIRYPDKLDNNVLEEVKNVASQGLTSQLVDYSRIAKHTGRIFILRVRPSTQLSRPLQDAIRCGDIDLQFIPGTR